MNRREHLLTILAEEAVEVAQRADKALRFGLSETQPGQEWTNVGRLGRELADLQAAVEMLAAEEPWIANVLLVVNRQQAIAEKKAKVEKFLAYSRECGTLQDESHPLVNEYEAWIRFFNAGDGDYTDFLRSRGLA